PREDGAPLLLGLRPTEAVCADLVAVAAREREVRTDLRSGPLPEDEGEPGARRQLLVRIVRRRQGDRHAGGVVLPERDVPDDVAEADQPAAGARVPGPQ